MSTNDITPTAHCNSCNAPIVWLKHAKTGKPAPINAAVDPGGNIVMYPDKGIYVVASPKEMTGFRFAYPDTQFHTNHFSNCPQARTWARHGGRGTR